jgi:hypothetical protein
MSEGVDEGEKKGGGNKRKEVDQEKIGGRKKKRSQTRPGEERREQGIMDTGQGVAIQDLAKGDRGTREESTQAGLYCTVRLGSTYGWGPLGTGLR